MNKLKQSVCPEDHHLESLYSKVPSAFYQHFYVKEDGKPERLTPRKLFSSPVTKNIDIE